MAARGGTRSGHVVVTSSLVRTEASSMHPLAWLAWLGSVSAAVFLTSNPLYLSLGFLVTGVVYLSVRHTAKGRALMPFVLMGLALAVATMPFNVLTGSTGPTELVTLPELTFPRWFGGVTFGGRVTAEALVTATTRAISVATLVLAAAAFNAAIDHFRLLRLAPRSMSQLMLSMTIAVVVIPQSVVQARRVAESRRLRGRRAVGLRAMPSLLLPVLQGSLERSIQRAESLDARGFGGGGERIGSLGIVVGVAGLGLCAWGSFAHFYSGPTVYFTVAMVVGAGLVAATMVRGRGPRSSLLSVDVWTRSDGLVASTAVLATGVILALGVSNAADVSYLAYPEIATPGFHAAGVFAFVLLLFPALREVTE